MDMKEVLKSYLEHVCGTENVLENEPLSKHTTFRIGGPARFFVTVPSKECLVRILSALEYIEQKYFILGRGSNVLATDKGFDGVVLKLGFSEIIEQVPIVYADAGATLRSVGVFARERGLSGLEWAAGIPATVGGAVYMNAGAHGGQMSDVVAMVDALVDGEIRALDTKQCKFGYRKSVFSVRGEGSIILGAYFCLKQSTKDEILAKEVGILAKRTTSQPNQPSAGSVFKKPPPRRGTPFIEGGISSGPFYVGKAIEELGLKGFSVGGAAVSEKHAGFIINKGGATARDVLKLIRIIRKKVFEKYGVRLQTEVKMLK